MSHRAASIKLSSIIALALIVSQAGCATRQSGQVEIFGIDATQGTLSRYSAGHANATRGVFPVENDPVRSNDDVLTVQIESAHLERLPLNITGSHDVIVFADVWEDAAAGYNSPSLTTIIYVGTNQKIPGKLNFRDALAYGPTTFKGHPLRIRVSVVLLQKNQSNQEASVVDVIDALASAAEPQYAVITDTVSKTLEGILKAQPDVKFFDFEVTLLSDKPQALVDPIVKAQAGTDTVIGVKNTPPEPVDATQWLRYGRFALVETETLDGKTVVRGLDDPSNILCRDGMLRYKDTQQPVDVSYMIVRVTPNQLSEQNDILKAAATANATLLQSLSRSDADIAQAIKDIKTQAGAMQDQVMRSKAETLARTIAMKAEGKNPNSSPTALQTAQANALKALNSQFLPQWTKVVDALPTDSQASATAVGKSVLDRWTSMFSDGTSTGVEPPTTNPAADPLAKETDRDAITMLLKNADADLSVNTVPFKITNAAFSESVAGGKFDTITVELTTTGNGSTKVALGDVKTEVVKQTGKAITSKLPTVTANPITIAVINKQDQIATVLQP